MEEEPESIDLNGLDILAMEQFCRKGIMIKYQSSRSTDWKSSSPDLTSSSSLASNQAVIGMEAYPLKTPKSEGEE